MCNIAGYSGSKQAAPILFEMIKKQEGLCGGFFTGISTIHNGKIYTAKVMGDADRLLNETDAINFPGTTGIIHSRSNSGGDAKWGHPFISNDGKLSFVANGAPGKYDSLAHPDKYVNLLVDNGIFFDTATNDNKKSTYYGTHPDGRHIHFSDILCQLTDYYIKKESPKTHLALERTLLTIPAEVVALALYEDDGEKISYAKYNMPMSMARTEDEVFLSSVALAFPKDRDYYAVEELPINSSGSITISETEIHHFRSPLKTGEITPSIMHKAYEIAMNTLKEKDECSIGMLNNAVREIWGEMVDLRYPVVYGILSELDKENKLEYVNKVIPGAEGEDNPQLTAPRTFVKLK